LKKEADMGGATVADICLGGTDSSGATILTVYTKIQKRYAIYKTDEGVSIQFADDPDRGDAQRIALAPLNPLRGQISGLIDGWRSSVDEGDRVRAALFDRRVAGALCAALQGCPGAVGHATTLLEEVKADVIAERTSKARVLYAVSAAGMAALLILIASLFTWNGYQNVYAYSPDAMMLWLGVGAAALGALFSVAIGLQSRAILTDLQRRQNVSDAILRVMIGSISGLVLIDLLLSQLVTVQIGNSAAITAVSPHSWLVAAFAAFLAGFSERLVPNLLEEGAAAAVRGRAPGGANPLAGPPPAPAARGPAPPPPAAPGPGGAAPPAAGLGSPPDAEDDLDGCAEGSTLADDEVTHDVELPAAQGGVEEAQPA
jgi:hypothetical protein